VLFRRIGNLRYMRKDMAPALVSRLTLSTPDRTEPVTSMDWVGIKSDTATLVVGFGKIRSSTEFKEVRIHAAGLEAVYGISERESGRIAGKVRGFRQAFAVLAVVGGTIAVTTLEKGISGASLGFLAGLLAAYHITTKD
jgi:hypothetical protein